MMIAYFIFTDFGWLKGKDARRAHTYMYPGKNCDGYFTNDDILAQASLGIDILEKDFPEYKHVFVYDNTKTHSKCFEDAISARQMPKGRQPWLLKVDHRDENGNLVYAEDGK